MWVKLGYCFSYESILCNNSNGSACTQLHFLFSPTTDASTSFWVWKVNPTWKCFTAAGLNGHQRAGGCKKTSWLVDWKTSLGSEICKHFSDKFMSSATYFWSYGIKHKVSFGNCAHSKSQNDWLSLACLLALDSQVLSQWTRSFTVKPVGDVMAASSCDALNSRS